LEALFQVEVAWILPGMFEGRIEGRIEGRRDRFLIKASALGPLFNWTFGTFRPFLDPLFGGCF
jgi:hypothetical protein